MGGQTVARILAIALNKDFTHPRICSASDGSLFTVTCSSSRMDTNELRLSFIFVTNVERESAEALISLASLDVSDSLYFKL